MRDPIEAAWSAYAKAMNRTGPTVAEENAIRLAIAAYHAAQPSDYAELVKDLQNRVAELENRFRHYHVSQGNSTDACAECGLDVRDKIHTRAELEKDDD